jgi:hypothetical protein
MGQNVLLKVQAMAATGRLMPNREQAGADYFKSVTQTGSALQLRMMGGRRDLAGASWNPPRRHPFRNAAASMKRRDA